MQKPPYARSLAALLLIAASLLAFTPQAQAVNSDWTSEYPSSLTDSVRELALAHDGERLGMAYRFSGSNAIGFSIRSTTGVWTQKSATAVAAADVTTAIYLYNLDPTTWVIIGSSATAAHFVSYKSSDDGVTWSSSHNIADNVVSLEAAVLSSTKMGAVYCKNDGAVRYQHSLDGGTSWTTEVRLDDNVGSPTSSSGTTAPCDSTFGKVGITKASDGNAYVVWSAAGKAYLVHTIGGGDVAWSVPFYNGGSCPSGCNPVDGGSTTLSYALNGFGGASSSYLFEMPRNGDVITVFRNQNSACNPGKTPNTLVYSATYLGNSPTDSSGGVCNTVSPAGTFKPITTASCSGYETTGTDHIAGNAGHTFIVGMGHTTLCGTAGFEIDLLTSLSGSWSRTYDDPSQTKIFAVDMTPSKAYAAFVDTTAGGLVKVVYANAPTASTPTASVAVSNLRGFDVDDSGAVAIARLSGGTTVQVFGGQTLSAGATATDSDCTGKLDGVSAYASSSDIYTTYFECANGSGAANSMKIRSGTLGSPVIPSTCNGFADGNVDTFLDVNVPDTLREISGLTSFPIDFSQCEEQSGPGVAHVTTAWAFSTTNGQVGVFAATQNNDLADHSDSAFITFDPGTSPDVAQMCAWAVDGVDHMGAVGLQAGTKFYLPTVSTHADGLTTAPDSAITLDYSPGGTFSLAKALSCAQYRAAIINEPGGTTPHSFAVICTVAGHCPTGISTGQPLWTPKTLTGTIASRAAVLSGNGAWASYIDLNGIHIVNATNGVEQSVFSEPETGVFWDMRMDRSGSSLWLAYTDNIYRYDISAATCGLNCTNTQTPPSSTTTSSSSLGTGGFLGIDPGHLDPSGNGNPVSGGFFMSLLLIIGMAGICAGIIPGNSPKTMIWGAMLGAVLGFAWTVFLGVMPAVITFILVVVGTLALGGRMFINSRSGAD